MFVFTYCYISSIARRFALSLLHRPLCSRNLVLVIENYATDSYRHISRTWILRSATRRHSCLKQPIYLTHMQDFSLTIRWSQLFLQWSVKIKFISCYRTFSDAQVVMKPCNPLQKFGILTRLLILIFLDIRIDFTAIAFPLQFSFTRSWRYLAVFFALSYHGILT